MNQALLTLANVRPTSGTLTIRSVTERNSIAQRWISARRQPAVEDLLDPAKLVADGTLWQNALAFLPLNCDDRYGSPDARCLASLDTGGRVVAVTPGAQPFHYGTLTMILGLCVRRVMKGADHVTQRLNTFEKTVKSMFGDEGMCMKTPRSADDIGVISPDTMNAIICVVDIAIEGGHITKQSPFHGSMSIIMEGHGFAIFSHLMKVAATYNISMREVVNGIVRGGFAVGQLHAALPNLAKYAETKLALMEARSGRRVLDVAHFNPDSIALDAVKRLSLLAVTILGGGAAYGVQTGQLQADVEAAQRAARLAVAYYERVSTEAMAEFVPRAPDDEDQDDQEAHPMMSLATLQC